LIDKGGRVIAVAALPHSYRADVGCSTFYSHYADKDELFESQLNRMVEMLIQYTPPAILERNPFFPSLGLFQHVQQQWKLYKLLSWEAGNTLQINRLQKSISDQIEQRIAAEGKIYVLPIPILANFMTGSLLSLLKWWLDNKMVYYSEQMNEMFQRLGLPGITQIAKT
jgi:AcrR family transcriptional regulator